MMLYLGHDILRPTKWVYTAMHDTGACCVLLDKFVLLCNRTCMLLIVRKGGADCFIQVHTAIGDTVAGCYF